MVRKELSYAYGGATDGYGGCPLCGVFRGMVLTLVEADPTNATLEGRALRMRRLRTPPNVLRGCWRQLTQARLRGSPGGGKPSQAAQNQ
jgi:hypothetical protein